MGLPACVVSFKKEIQHRLESFENPPISFLSLFRGLYCSSWRRRVVDKKQLGQNSIQSARRIQNNWAVGCYEVSRRDSTPSSFSRPPSSVIDVCLSLSVCVFVIECVREAHLSCCALPSSSQFEKEKQKKNEKLFPANEKFILFLCVFVLSAHAHNSSSVVFRDSRPTSPFLFPFLLTVVVRI